MIFSREELRMLKEGIDSLLTETKNADRQTSLQALGNRLNTELADTAPLQGNKLNRDDDGELWA